MTWSRPADRRGMATSIEVSSCSPAAHRIALVCRWRPGRQATVVWSREPRDSAPPPLGGFALSSEGTPGINHKCCAAASQCVASTRASAAKSAPRRSFGRFAEPPEPKRDAYERRILPVFRSRRRHVCACRCGASHGRSPSGSPRAGPAKLGRLRSAVGAMGYAGCSASCHPAGNAAGFTV